MRSITLETVFYYIAFFIHALEPITFYGSWILLMILGQRIVKDGSITARKFVFAAIVGTPIGVLSAMAFAEYFGKPQMSFTASIVGCVVAIMAEQVLNGDLPRRVVDVVLGNFNKNKGE